MLFPEPTHVCPGYKWGPVSWCVGSVNHNCVLQVGLLSLCMLLVKLLCLEVP